MSVKCPLAGRWISVGWPLCVHARYDMGHSSIDMGHSRYGTRLGDVSVLLSLDKSAAGAKSMLSRRSPGF